jgi:dynein heavy chain
MHTRFSRKDAMYGGHITDDWDRLLCWTYLKVYMREDFFDEMELLPYVEDEAKTPSALHRHLPTMNTRTGAAVRVTGAVQLASE